MHAPNRSSKQTLKHHNYIKQIKNYTAKKSCRVATPRKKHKILTTSTCNFTKY